MDIKEELLKETVQTALDLSAEIRRLKDELNRQQVMFDDFRAAVTATLKDAGFVLKGTPASSRNQASCLPRTEEHTNVEGIPDTPLDRAIREESRLKEIGSARTTWLRPGHE